MLSNCSAEEDSWESLGLQGDQTSQSSRKLALNIQPFQFVGRTAAEAEAPILWPPDAKSWKRPWCWERLKAGGEGCGRGWDGWMASLTQWTWVWADSRGEWTGNPVVLPSIGLQMVRHDLANKQRHKSPPSWASLARPHPAPWVITEHRAGLPVPSSRIPQALCSPHSSVYTSELLSHTSHPPYTGLHVHPLHLCLCSSPVKGSSVSPFWIPYICISMQYLLFSFWLTLLCVMDSRSIHITTNDLIVFLFMDK